MVTISPNLIYKHLSSSPQLKFAFQLIEGDDEIIELLRMSNIMAVSRLRYNDHGIVHARIVAGTALELVDILNSSNIVFTTLRDGTTRSLDDIKIIMLLSAYFHDIGNTVHRMQHELIGVIIAKDIVHRILKDLGYDTKRVIALRQEILHNIYSTAYDARCLTIECSIIKLSDGLDMSEGRARIPYRLGKMDMHAVSALSIKYVDIEKGIEKPIKIIVHMSEIAGLFQLEEVLLPKIKTGLLEDSIEIFIENNGRLIKFYPS